MFLSTDLWLANVEQDFLCDVDFSGQPKLQAYPELDDHDTNTCHIFEIETSRKLQITYSVTNMLSPNEFGHIRVTYGEPINPCVRITFMHHWRNGQFRYKEYSVIREGHGFIVKCALECATDLHILMQWIPGCQPKNLRLCHVELMIPARTVEPNTGSPWMPRHMVYIRNITVVL